VGLLYLGLLFGGGAADNEPVSRIQFRHAPKFGSTTNFCFENLIKCI
jgi:hypothetical protein